MLELTVLENKPEEAINHLAKAIAIIREKWEPETTANNLKMIQQSREDRGEDTSWLKQIISDLDKRTTS